MTGPWDREDTGDIYPKLEEGLSEFDSKEKKPREFWLERGSFAWACHESKDRLNGWGNPVHVIEKTAYDLAIELLREAEIKLVYCGNEVCGSDVWKLLTKIKESKLLERGK